MLKNYIEKGGNKKKKNETLIIKITMYLMTLSVKFKIIIKTLLFIYKNKKSILKNKFIVIYASRTFGHDLHFMEVVSRLYYPRNLSFIYVPNEKINKFLLEAYSHNLKFFLFNVNPKLNEWTARFLKLIFFYFEVKYITWPRNYIVDPRHLIQVLSVDEGLYNFAPEENKTSTMYKFCTKTPLGQLRYLIRNNIGKSPSLPKNIKDDCINKIKKKWPNFFDKPMVALVLRRKGHLGMGMNGRLRMAGPHENYTKSVKYLIKEGFNVVGTGDTLHEKFNMLTGYFDLTEAGILEDCANIFILSNSEIYIGQNSGPYPMVNSTGGRSLITDAQPLAHAPIGDNDLVLYKDVIVKGVKKEISEIFLKRPELCFDQITFENDVKVIDNTASEILLSVKEMVNLYKGGKTSARVLNLSTKLKDIAPKNGLLAHFKSRPPAFVLKRNEKFLLKKNFKT